MVAGLILSLPLSSSQGHVCSHCAHLYLPNSWPLARDEAWQISIPGVHGLSLQDSKDATAAQTRRNSI